ncbi:MAG: tetratricopeptide repeat protein, partial [Hydrogenobacter thermophilus]|nr:tetratricopeptide repeat protein [Hydrogenobacter thermophilus]
MGYSVIRIALLLAGVCLLVGAFLGWRWWESRRLSKISYQEYQIRREIQSGNYQEAQKLIKKVAEEESPYTPLVLSYQLYLEREGGLQVDEVKTLQ